MPNKIDYLEITPKRTSNFQAYVPISFGCNNFCTYCAVPYTRGREISRPSKLIIQECKNLIKNGYKEITLLGQNVNSYGQDLKNELKFPELLKKIDDLKGDFRLLFISPHPKDVNDDLIEVMKNSKHLYHYLNLPVQSGNNEVLKRMNRHYTHEQYVKLVKKIRSAIPDIILSTDTIVGFPGETKKQFNDSAKLFREVEFDMAFLAQFSSRAGTPAAKMKDNVTKNEKKHREEILNSILKKTALKHAKKMIGQTVEVLVDSCNKGICFGRTKQYKKIMFNSKKDLTGKFVKLKITKAQSFGLFAVTSK